MMKFAVLAVLPFLLSACGVPTAVVLTTYAVDGVTYVGSGKTLTAHAMSAATDKDCSVLFGLTRGELCKDKEIPDELAQRDAGFRVPKEQPTVGEVAALPAAPSGPTETQTGSTETPPVFDPPFFDFDYESPPIPEVEVKATSVAPAAPAAEKPSVVDKPVAEVSVADKPVAHKPVAHKPQWALVLGSFVDYRDAVELARQVKPEPGLVTTILVNGEIHYRVSTRPLKREQTEARQLNIVALKLENVELMPVCPTWVQNDSCIALDRTLAIQQATLP